MGLLRSIYGIDGESVYNLGLITNGKSGGDRGSTVVKVLYYK